MRRFIDHVNEDPWNWTPTMVEDFSADLRAVKHVAHSTLRGYHSALRAFTSYISNPDYGWDRVCERYFGTHPAQVFFDWNTAPHVQAYDGRPSKRPYTREELDALFEHADNEVERVGRSGRKGWQAAYRDAVMMKITYGYGLRFNELRHLQTIDFARNPHAREFGAFGVCKVRYGKSRRSSPYKGRSVLTVWRWTPGILEDWLANGRGEPGSLDLFPSERGGLVVESTLLRRLRRYCAELGLAEGLDIHSFRRSYATHLLEAGWDPRFVQDEMGHEYASTTGIYQFTSDEFRRSTLRAALDRRCGEEAGHHRGKLCARCALRDDLNDLVGTPPHEPQLLGLIEALCASDRPESIIV